jgi:hypothetical protein
VYACIYVCMGESVAGFEVPLMSLCLSAGVCVCIYVCIYVCMECGWV